VHSSQLSDLQKQKTYFVNTYSTNPEQDSRLSDIGNLIVACQSSEPAFSAGELYVEYEIVLHTPSQNSDLLSANIQAGGDVSGGLYFGTIPIITGPITLGLAQSPSRFEITVPISGYFYMVFKAYFNTAQGTPSPTVTVTSGATYIFEYDIYPTDVGAPLAEGTAFTAFVFLPDPDSTIAVYLQITGGSLEIYNNGPALRLIPISPQAFPTEFVPSAFKTAQKRRVINTKKNGVSKTYAGGRVPQVDCDNEKKDKISRELIRQFPDLEEENDGSCSDWVVAV